MRVGCMQRPVVNKIGITSLIDVGYSVLLQRASRNGNQLSVVTWQHVCLLLVVGTIGIYRSTPFVLFTIVGSSFWSICIHLLS